MSCEESIPGRPNILTTSPVLYSIGSAQPVVLTSGPFVSIIRARWGETVLTFFIILRIPSGVACAVFIRTTFIPAKNNLRRNSTSQRRSLIEATIFVCFIVCIFICFSYAKLLIFLEKPPIFTTHKILNMCNS